MSATNPSENATTPTAAQTSARVADADNGIVAWLRARYDLSALEEFMSHKQVPMHRHSVWYYFGGITLFFLGIQIFTGILLLFYYRPSAESAFESVQFIMTEVRFGWLIRSIHSWSANLMVAAAFIHLFSVYFLKAYRKPRELTWVSGVAMLYLCLAFGFSGYLLPWNELAYFATKVGTEIVAVIPLIGKPLMVFLRGGEEVTGATLTRFFGIHVAVLPLLVFLLVAFHVMMVQMQGMSVPPAIERSGRRLKSMPFFPNFLLRDLLGYVIALGCLAAIAALFPWELGVKADPFASAPAGIRPEWYFVFMFQTLKYIPAKILFLDGEVVGVLAFGLLGLWLLLVPFLDRQSQEGRSGRLFNYLGVAAIVFIIVMTALSYMETP